MIVVDASVVLAVILGESGADEAMAKGQYGLISAVNYNEVLGKLIDHDYPSAEAIRWISALQLTIRPFDAHQAEKAAALRPLTRHLGVSLADRACLALAKDLAAPVLTGDRAWTKLDIGVDVRLFR